MFSFFLVLDSLDSHFQEFLFFRFSSSTKLKILVIRTLFSVKVTNIYPSFIADDARIMAKRPVILN